LVWFGRVACPVVQKYGPPCTLQLYIMCWCLHNSPNVLVFTQQPQCVAQQPQCVAQQPQCVAQQPQCVAQQRLHTTMCCTTAATHHNVLHNSHTTMCCTTATPQCVAQQPHHNVLVFAATMCPCLCSSHNMSMFTQQLNCFQVAGQGYIWEARSLTMSNLQRTTN
jgi:hypothetical protein